jgi:hypothetical protein
MAAYAFRFDPSVWRRRVPYGAAPDAGNLSSV